MLVDNMTRVKSGCILYIRRVGSLIFDCNSRMSWLIFIILAPMETGINTTQSGVVYLLNCLMMSYLEDC